jgi:hypothetical protein
MTHFSGYDQEKISKLKKKILRNLARVTWEYEIVYYTLTLLFFREAIELLNYCILFGEGSLGI